MRRPSRSRGRSRCWRCSHTCRSCWRRGGNRRLRGTGRWRRARLHAVSSAGVEKLRFSSSAPQDHFSSGPDCRVTESRGGRVGRAGGCPTLGAGIVFPSGVKLNRGSETPPYDHLIPSPDCCVGGSTLRRIGDCRGCPSVCLGVVSSAGIQGIEKFIQASPDNHLISGPNCGM